MHIKKEQIEEWAAKKHFQEEAHAEIDLRLEFLLNATYQKEWLRKHLIFKGGTALHKIHLKENLRFSEDIDLEHRQNQKMFETINQILHLFEELDMEGKGINQKNNYKILSFYNSEITNQRERVKMEIGYKEDFSILGYTEKILDINNVCFASKVLVNTYDINEILSQKTRALYQRFKGRDLYDLFVSRLHPDFDIEKIAKCFIRHMTNKKTGNNMMPVEKEFILNIEKKEDNPDFINDIYRCLKTNVEYNQSEAFEWAKKDFVPDLIQE